MKELDLKHMYVQHQFRLATVTSHYIVDYPFHPVINQIVILSVLLDPANE